MLGCAIPSASRVELPLMNETNMPPDARKPITSVNPAKAEKPKARARAHFDHSDSWNTLSQRFRRQSQKMGLSKRQIFVRV